MANNDGCNTVLENMQKCLMECQSNTKTYFSKQSIDLTKCENIRVYERSLAAATGLKIVYNHKIDEEKPYQIIYDTGSKSLTIKKYLDNI
jgi:hypothetical protein